MPLRWYRVPEVWLVLAILSASIIGSIWLISAAVNHPDAPVPNLPAGPLSQAHPVRTGS